MKKILFTMLSLVLCFSLTACTGGDSTNTSDKSTAEDTTKATNASVKTDDLSANTNASNKKVLVAYFSCTGNTEAIARKIAKFADAATLKIEPLDEYTAEDLNYSADTCRAKEEHDNPSIRPKIKPSDINTADFDVIFIGYPIWWGEAPNIIHTFIENNDLSSKTIIPFCTSGSSDIGTSAEFIKTDSKYGILIDGKRFSNSTADDEIAKWVKTLKY